MEEAEEAVARWEGVARRLLEDMGVDEPLDPRLIARAYGLRLVPALRREACWSGSTIRYPAGVRATRQAGVIAHELGHYGLYRYDQEQSEQGASFVGAAVLVPRAALDRELRRVGWELPALSKRFPHASSELLARRIAEVREAVVTVIDGRRIKARVASPRLGPPPKSLTPRERAILDRVRAEGAAHDDLIRGWHIHEPGYDRVILIADAEQLALRF